MAEVSQRNLDLVRSIYAAWERGDFGVTSWADTRLEFVRVDGPTPGTLRGLGETRPGWREFLRDWDDFRAEAEEYRELDGERVLVLHHFGGRGKRSGAELGLTGSKGACLFHVTDGRVTRLTLYAVRERALADLGLAPGGE
jgi:ketosteroid isomerase-like protein